jgi:hypothetical protein
MKKALFCVVLLSCMAVQAQLPSHKTSLTLDARSVSSGGGTSTARSGGSRTLNIIGGGQLSAATSSTTQTHESKIRLEVEMRNLGTTPAQARLEWYFIARKESSGGHPGAVYIWDSGKRDISVVPGSSDQEALESTALTQMTVQASTAPTSGYINGQLVATTGSGYTRRSGSKPAGWIVRLMDGDQVLRVQASSGDLVSVAQDTARLTQLGQK